MVGSFSNYTKIPNNIYDNLLKAKIPLKEKEVLFAIIRLTYGFNKPERGVALSLLQNIILTDKATISKQLKNLINKKIIIETQKPSFNKFRKMKLNENIDEWLLCNSINSTVDIDSTETVDLKSTNKLNDINDNINKLYLKYLDRYPHQAEYEKISEEYLDPDLLHQVKQKIILDAFRLMPLVEETKKNTSYLLGIIRKKKNEQKSKISNELKKEERKSLTNKNRQNDVKLNLVEQFNKLKNS